MALALERDLSKLFICLESHETGEESISSINDVLDNIKEDSERGKACCSHFFVVLIIMRLGISGYPELVFLWK